MFPDSKGSSSMPDSLLSPRMLKMVVKFSETGTNDSLETAYNAVEGIEYA